MRVAILTSNTGVERAELQSPRSALTDRGWTVEHLASESGSVRTMEADVEPSELVSADRAVADANVDDYDALVLPGGTVNADKLRLDENALAFVKSVAAAGKPVAAICHGPWLLVEAGLVRGKTLTSFPSLRTDITNAGGAWVDQRVQHCEAEGWHLITSRTPDDLDAFNAAIVHALEAQAS